MFLENEILAWLFSSQEMRLIPENEALEQWANFSDPIYLSVYLFNITNAEDFQEGAVPILQELGPYVYLERRTKQVDHIDKEKVQGVFVDLPIQRDHDSCPSKSSF